MIRFVVDNVFTFVRTPSPQERGFVDCCLSYKEANYQIKKKRMLYKHPQSRYWLGYTGEKSFYMPEHNAFLTGLLGKVTAYCRSAGITYEILDKRRKPNGSAGIHKEMLHGITLYDYQERTVREVADIGRGVVQLPTGAGKTEIAIAATKAINVPTLFLTHRVNLLYQTAQRYVDRNPEIQNQIGIIGDGNYTPSFITLATVQTLQSLMKRHPGEILPILAKFQMLIVDEAHRSGSKQFHQPAIFCRNAYYRLALTATPFMNGNVESDMYLMGITGPVASRVTNYELIERGILARPLFKFFTIDTPDLSKHSGWQAIYERGITHNEQRNKLIAIQAAKLAEAGKKVLTIVLHKSHGQNLLKLMKARGIKVQYSDGDDSYSERARSLKWLSKNGQVLIATNIFDEGIDVKDINGVILAAGTKSAPALFQRTGRATRKKDTDNYAIIVDFIDRQHPRLFEHSIRRYNLVKNEKGFTIL